MNINNSMLVPSGLSLLTGQQEEHPYYKQVRKVLWTWKAPACLLTALNAYDKPHLCSYSLQIYHPRFSADVMLSFLQSKFVSCYRLKT